LLLFFRWLPHLLTFSQNPLQLFFTQARHVNVTTNHGDHVTLSVGFEPLHLAQPCPMYMYTRSHRRLVVYTTSTGDHFRSERAAETIGIQLRGRLLDRATRLSRRS
jgi:hypothetical protein